MSEQTKVSIASDHAGFDLKDQIIKRLLDCGVDVIDRGPDKKDPVDYPDYASKVTNDILNEKAHKGVLVCGTGQGMAMAANKKPGIRAALCYSSEVTKLAREHNDANILTLGGIGLVVLMLAVITGFVIIETQLESLALKSFFSILALLIYLGILSLIKFNNLQLKNAVRMLLLSFIMILVSYSFSNAAINLS